MPRKATSVVQLKLRIREPLRRRIEQAAKKRGVSANYEMTKRLEWSFDRDAQRTIDDIASDIQTSWARFAWSFHELNLQGDLLRAAEQLVVKIEQLPLEQREQESVKAAVSRLQKVIKVIELAAVRTVRAAHTGGGS